MAATGTRLAQEALGNAPGRRRPALASFSAFSFVPPKREGPPELSYFGRAHKLKYLKPIMYQRLKQREAGRRWAHCMARSQKFLLFIPLADNCSLDCFTQEIFSPMMMFLEYQKITTNIFHDVTENTQRLMALKLMRRKWQELFLC
ncbi:cilia- and flagella-associated protein 90 isoform X1 [Taeniopygia guttata]|uniref:cilia- and flagella-associated protein 90 isoform X1 n=1 Tax=Taeniopygia guttata TaxID=59729 RepID=UPI0013F2A9FB